MEIRPCDHTRGGFFLLEDLIFRESRQGFIEDTRGGDLFSQSRVVNELLKSLITC